MLLKLSSYKFKLEYYNSRTLNVIPMITTNRYRIYTKGNENVSLSTKHNDYKKKKAIAHMEKKQ